MRRTGGGEGTGGKEKEGRGGGGNREMNRTKRTGGKGAGCRAMWQRVE